MPLKTQIVVLDGFTLNPGDLSWEPIKRHGCCVIHDRTPAAEILPRSQEAEVLLTNKTLLTARTIEQLPRLRYIGVLATGYDVVDVDAARKRGIIVTNVPGYGTHAVAQHTWSLKTGRIAGAALDVLSAEPPAATNPLLHCPRCLITPHIAWASLAARRRLLEIAGHNLASFLSGSPTNVVNSLNG